MTYFCMFRDRLQVKRKGLRLVIWHDETLCERFCLCLLTKHTRLSNKQKSKAGGEMIFFGGGGGFSKHGVQNAWYLFSVSICS